MRDLLLKGKKKRIEFKKRTTILTFTAADGIKTGNEYMEKINNIDVPAMVENYRKRSSSTVSVNMRPIDALCKAYEMGVKDTLLEVLQQKNWKPTAYQMAALQHAASNNTLSCEELNTLSDLYEQLKRL